MSLNLTINAILGRMNKSTNQEYRIMWTVVSYVYCLAKRDWDSLIDQTLSYAIIGLFLEPLFLFRLDVQHMILVVSPLVHPIVVGLIIAASVFSFYLAYGNKIKRLYRYPKFAIISALVIVGIGSWGVYWTAIAVAFFSSGLSENQADVWFFLLDLPRFISGQMAGEQIVNKYYDSALLTFASGLISTTVSYLISSVAGRDPFVSFYEHVIRRWFPNLPDVKSLDKKGDAAIMKQLRTAFWLLADRSGLFF